MIKKLFKFKKSSRLLNQEDFLYLKTSSKKTKSKNLILYSKKSRLESQKTRVGFAVSRKVAKSVIRNKIKRVFREEFRKSQYVDLGVDVLVVVSNNLLNSQDKSVTKKALLHNVIPDLKMEFLETFKKLSK